MGQFGGRKEDKMREFSVRDLRAACKSRGYRFFASKKHPYNLNIFGIRSQAPILNEFRCVIAVVWKGDTRWEIVQFPATTLPGRYYLINRLLNRRGCAILVPGQYQGAYKLGLHRRRYQALVQKAPVRVFRDGNRDEEFDFITEESGRFGINIHRATDRGFAPKVGKHSAGCQVFQRTGDFYTFIKLCGLASEHWGNSFTYTLLMENEI